MQAESNVIGEGGFGCVFYPSLQCSEQGVDYHGKVSKVLPDDKAKEELQENSLVAKLDPDHRFTLGSPVKCTPSEQSFAAMQKCSRRMQENFIDSGSGKIKPETRLLIMQNGGSDLYSTMERLMAAGSTGETRSEMDRLWHACVPIFEGLKIFNENGLLHHDLKLENIVWNYEKLALIDFGEMTTIVSYVEKLENPFQPLIPAKRLNYPPEVGVYKNANKKCNFVPMFWHVLPEQEPERSNLYAEIMASAQIVEADPLVAGMKRRSVETWDLYGLCLGLLILLQHTRMHEGNVPYTQLNSLFLKGIDPNPLTRIRIDEATDELKRILGVEINREVPQNSATKRLRAGRRTRRSKKKRTRSFRRGTF